MHRLFTEESIEKENQVFSGTAGVSSENHCNGFRPAFCDSETGRVEITRLLNSDPAPMHSIAGLPEGWVVERDADAKPIAIKHTVIAGFIRDGWFYTRSQAAEAVQAETTQCLQAGFACG